MKFTWPYRKDGTSADETVFDADNWTYSGVDGLKDETSNALAALPVPIGVYSPIPEAEHYAIRLGAVFMLLLMIKRVRERKHKA